MKVHLPMTIPSTGYWILAMVWSIIVLLVVPVRFSYEGMLAPIAYTLVFLIFSLLFIVVFRRVAKYQSAVTPAYGQRFYRRLMIISSLACIAVWSVYWAIFYPGLISWDFYVQWHEMARKIPYSDWHPVFHTFMMWLVTRIWYSPAMVSLVQILSMGLLVGMAAVRLARVGTPFGVVVAMVTFYAVFPLFGFYAVSLWKDIGYAIAVLWLSVLVLDIVSSDGLALQNRLTILSLFLACFFVALMRHNGIVPAFGTLFVSVMVYRKQFKPLLLLTLSLAIAIVLFKGPVVTFFKVDMQAKNILKAHLPIQHIGAILNANGYITEEDAAFLNQKILPLPYWKKAYNPRSCMPLIFGKKKDGNHYLDQQILKSDENYHRLLKIWIKLAMQNPRAILCYYRDASELVWRIRSQYRPFVIADEDLNEEDLYSGYKPSPRLSQRVGAVGRFLIRLINDNSKGWYLHRGALYFWLVLFFMSLMVIRNRNGVVLLLAIPMLFQAATVAVFPLVQDTRFMFPVMLVAPLLVAVFFSRQVGGKSLGETGKVTTCK